MLSGDPKYMPCYCEENIWQLAQESCFHGHETVAVIVSGHGPYRKLWFQRSAETPGAPVLWDYHVVLLSRQNGWQVWDLDTTLELPASATTYFSKTFLQEDFDPEHKDVIFRLIPAPEYVENFSSDRSHMWLPSGSWVAPPPQWPIIFNGERSNLPDWLDVRHEAPGKVLTLAELMRDVLASEPTI